MKHTDYYKQYKEIEANEYAELKKAVLAHGGEFRFQDEDGNDIDDLFPPIICASNRHWESSCDCVVTRITVVDGCIKVYGYDKDYSDEEVLLDDIEFGHISFIIDEIPETEETHDVTI